MLIRMIPKVFYADVGVGIDLFVGCLGFQVLHRDDTLVVIGRDGAKVYLVQDADFAAKDRPELTIETDSIDAVYNEVRTKAPQVLHPNAKAIERKPWGALEFAVRDSTDVCVIFRQW